MTYPTDFVEAFDRAEASANEKNTYIEAGMSRCTYGEVCAAVRKLTSLYRQWGLQPGDRVAFSTKDDIHASILFLSLLRNGLPAVFLDPETKRQRAEHLVRVAEPRALLLDTDLQAAWGLSGVEHVLGIDFRRRSNLVSRLLKRDRAEEAPATYPFVLANLAPAELPDAIDPEIDAYVLFTSGTTSDPKGVRISHRALNAHLATLSRLFGYGPDSRLLNILILSHADGVIQGPVVTFYNAAQLFRPMRFSIQKIQELLDAVYHHRITHFISVPTMLSLIERFGSDEAEAFLTDDFRFIVSCGAQLEADLWQRFEDRFQVRIANVYGLTETVVGGLFSGPEDGSHRVGTVGRPVDCEARIVDGDGRDVAPGEAGELLLKGSNLMSGYLNAPQATAEVFLGEWFRTGDVARCDDGLYRIVGRKKAIIISGGVNIHPEEVTEVLNRCPGVREAVTLGVPDPVWGEKVVSAVCLEGGAQTEDDLIRFCRQELEEVKVPDRIYVLESLPRGRSGKVQLDAVRERIQGAVTTGPDESDVAEERVLDIAARAFKVPRASLALSSTTENTAGWDSLSHLEFVLALEESFGIAFTPAEIMQMDGLAEVLAVIRKKPDGRG